MKEKRLKFQVVLTQAVHEGLSCISPSVPQVVLFYLKNNASIKSDQYIDDPRIIEDGLTKIFGCGAKVIERKILEVLYLKLDFPLQLNDEFEFTEEVRKAQRLLHPAGLVTAATQ